MDLVQSLINLALIALLGVVLNYLIRDRIRQAEDHDKTRYEALRAQMDMSIEALRAHMDASFDALRAQMDSRFESVDRQQASVRSDLTQIALAMGAQPRPQAG